MYTIIYISNFNIYIYYVISDHLYYLYNRMNIAQRALKTLQKVDENPLEMDDGAGNSDVALGHREACGSRRWSQGPELEKT